ncbi:MAG: ABC transporter permease [Candidatus Aminicenantes bacterium]|nr:ABC transporter permease [Candidatus Aminicenantes bacterium]
MDKQEKTKYQHPPKAAQWFLKTAYTDRGRFTHLGDFAQVYNQLYREQGPMRARLWYWAQTVKTLPFIVSTYFYWSFAMLKNYLVTTFRYFIKRKGFSFINVAGLAFGIAVIILIGQFLYFEFSYDRFHPNIDRIYQLVNTEENSYSNDYRMRDRIIENIPQVQNACVYNTFSIEANVEENVFEFEHMLFVGPSFFEMFHFPFVKGDASISLAALDSLVLTESAARRMFGTEDPIGKSVLLDHQDIMYVTGVVKDFPLNSSFQAELFASAENTKQKRLKFTINCRWYDGKDDSQCRYPYRIFLEVAEGTDIPLLEEQIASLFTGEDFRFPNTLGLTPFKRSYLYNRYYGSMLAHGNMGLLKILSAIGLLVLVLAIVNYVNLSTAAVKYRIKEIGIKKCVGAQRKSLVFQFLGESFFVCLAAAFLGLLFAQIFLPLFNQFIEKPQHIQILSNPGLFILFAAFIFLLSTASGIYPAFVLSGIVPIQLLRPGGRTDSVRSGTLMRNILNVFQFAVTIGLIAGLMIMTKQIRYVKHKDLGFNTERLLTLRLHHKMEGAVEAIKNRLSQHSGISKICLSSGIPGKISIHLGGFSSIIISPDFLDTYGINIIDGRALLPGDINKACLVNQSGLKEFDNEDFHGKKVNDMDVVGVFSDIHYSSFHQEIGPLALMHYGTNWGSSHISMRLSGRLDEGLDFIRKTWMEFAPNFPFEYHFIDDWFDAMYRKEENLAKLISIFAVLAVVISCLGLFGLSLFSAEQRTKEIGIRKVLGSSVREIVLLLTKSSMKWALLGNLIAWPAAWYAMSKWLENFAFRTDLSWWIFVLAGAIVLLIGVLTVSWQTFRAAAANPVDTLRYE